MGFLSLSLPPALIIEQAMIVVMMGSPRSTGAVRGWNGYAAKQIARALSPRGRVGEEQVGSVGAVGTVQPYPIHVDRFAGTMGR